MQRRKGARKARDEPLLELEGIDLKRKEAARKTVIQDWIKGVTRMERVTGT